MLVLVRATLFSEWNGCFSIFLSFTLWGKAVLGMSKLEMAVHLVHSHAPEEQMIYQCWWFTVNAVRIPELMHTVASLSLSLQIAQNMFTWVCCCSTDLRSTLELPMALRWTVTVTSSQGSSEIWYFQSSPFSACINEKQPCSCSCLPIATEVEISLCCCSSKKLFSPNAFTFSHLYLLCMCVDV